MHSKKVFSLWTKLILISAILSMIAACSRSSSPGSQVNYDYALPPENALTASIQKYFRALQDEDWETVHQIDINTQLLSPEEVSIYYQTANLMAVSEIIPNTLTTEWFASRFRPSSGADGFFSAVRSNAQLHIQRDPFWAISGLTSGWAYGRVQFSNGFEAPYFAGLAKGSSDEEWRFYQMNVFTATEPTTCELEDANLDEASRIGLCNARLVGRHPIGNWTRLVDVDFAYDGSAKIICLRDLGRREGPTETTFFDPVEPHHPCIETKQSGTFTIFWYNAGDSTLRLQFSEFVESVPNWPERLTGEAASEIRIKPIHIAELSVAD